MQTLNFDLKRSGWQKNIKILSYDLETHMGNHGKSSDNMQPEYDIICMVKSDSMPTSQIKLTMANTFYMFSGLVKLEYTRIENFTTTPPSVKKKTMENQHILKSF